jgi:hypothetical protein
MHIYQEIYEFAASAGAFEGYVYRRPEAEIDFKALSNWVDNLLDAYRHLAPDVLSEFQSAMILKRPNGFRNNGHILDFRFRILDLRIN